jgi:hypothetical protein
MEMYEGMEVQLHIFMEVSGQASCPGHFTHRVGDWVGLVDILDTNKEKNLCPPGNQAFILWLPSLVTYLLYLILVKNHNGTEPFGVLGVDGAIILK